MQEDKNTNFNYSVHDIRECLIHSERELRNLVFDIMFDGHGADWETNPTYGFAKEDQVEITERIRDEKSKIPNLQHSSRLLDYSYIRDLQKIITKNWQSFSHIFRDKQKLIIFFDLLSDYRNPIMHGRSGLKTHQKYLCLGVCGELLNVIKAWRLGYRNIANSFECYLHFGVNEEEPNGELKAEKLAKEWMERVSKKKFDDLKVTFQDHDSYEETLIRLPAGHIRLLIRKKISRLSDIVDAGTTLIHFWSKDITLRTTSSNAIDEVMRRGQHPYWGVKIGLTNKLDLQMIQKNFEYMRHGKTFSARKISNIHLVFHTEEEESSTHSYSKLDISLDIYSKSMDISYDGRPNKGLFNAHKVFSPDTILSILYGKIIGLEKNELVSKSRISP